MHKIYLKRGKLMRLMVEMSFEQIIVQLIIRKCQTIPMFFLQNITNKGLWLPSFVPRHTSVLSNCVEKNSNSTFQVCGGQVMCQKLYKLTF